MEGLGMFILFCFLITFAPPVLFLIIGLIKHRSNKSSAKVYYIMGIAWLVVGGGICASIMGGA